ncbi:MAG TPA: HEAT repeat domain-containing protein [Planctomycetaceae bacterium]|nr:HEAT repeat domain-containing protein [Planctomycetaceae bacterium]
MPLTVTCQCGTKVEASQDPEEKRVNCPNCGAVIFLMGLSEAGDVPDTYGIAASDILPDVEPVSPIRKDPDSAGAVRPPGWFDRYKASPEAKKADRSKALELILKAGEMKGVGDPFAAALYEAVTRPDAESAVATLARVAGSGHPVYGPIASAFLDHVGPSEGRAARESLKLLQEADDPQLEQVLTKCLLKIGPVPFIHVRELIDVLNGKQTALYLWAVQCLTLIGPAARNAGDVLFKTLKLTQVELRLAIIDALGAIGRDAERVIPLLQQALKHQSADYRRRGAAALGRFGAAASPATGLLTAALKDESPAVRQAAESALQSLNAAAQKDPASAGASPGAAGPPSASLLVLCACGKKLRIKVELAGRKVKCPACNGVVTVPVPPRASEEKVCPACLATVPTTVVLCVHCGLDFRTGKPVGASNLPVAAP